MVVSRLDSLIVMHQHFDHQLAGVVHLEARLSRNQSKPQAASPPLTIEWIGVSNHFKAPATSMRPMRGIGTIHRLYANPYHILHCSVFIPQQTT